MTIRLRSSSNTEIRIRPQLQTWPSLSDAGFGVHPKFGGIGVPVVQTNFTTTSSLPSWISFSRTSNATLYDSTGKLTYAPNNIALYSQDLTNWTADGANVTSSTETAPDGSATATLLTAASGNYRRYRVTTFTVGTAYIYSVYVKQGTAATVQTDVVNQVAGPIFTFATQTYVGGVGVSNHTVTNVGNGWFRLSFKLTPSAASIGPGIAMNGATVGQTVYVWGQQAEAVTYQTTPSTYQPTTTAAYYGPRFDYDPSTVPATPRGLLIEESRSNLLTYSEQFDNAAWVKAAASVTANATTAPDGTTTVDKLTPDVTNAQHKVTITASSGSANNVISVYAKVAGYNWLIVQGSGYAWFDISNGAVGTQTSCTGSITSVGNGWYRCSIVMSTASTSVSIWASNGNNVTSFAGDGTSGIFIWGAQLEAGAFATSYIPTTTASVTRAADVAQLTGSALTTATATSASAIVQTTALLDSAGNHAYIGMSSVLIPLFVSGSNTTFYSYGGATRSAIIGSGTFTGSPVRLAIGWGATTASIVGNNGNITSAANVFGGGSAAYLGSYSGTNAYNLDGWIASVALYNQRLPDAILKQKSVVGAPY